MNTTADQAKVDQEQMLEYAVALLIYLLSDSPRLRDRQYQHRVREGINEALRRYIDATPDDEVYP